MRLLNGRQTAPIPLLPLDLVLDASGRKQLRDNTREISVSCGQIIAEEGALGLELLSLTEGVVKLSKALSDERRMIVAFRSAGDMVSLHRSDTPWPATAQAISDCRLVKIRWDVLRRIADNYPALDRTLFELVSDEAVVIQNRLLTLGRKTSEERLASFLLEFSLPSAAPSSLSREVFLPMRRPDIADYLGMTTESISREFTRFKRQRIIAMPRPSCVVILNRLALEAVAMGKAGTGSRSFDSKLLNCAPEQQDPAVAASQSKPWHDS